MAENIMKNEAKAAINILFKNFNVFMRHMFSGLVAVFLFEIGNSGAKPFANIEVVKDMKLSQGVCYALAALVVGNLTYLLSRYVICALIMWGLHKRNPSKYSRGLAESKSAGYIVDIGRFAQYRWSEEFSPKLNEYLINAWGWIHGLGSVAIVLIVIPLYFDKLNKAPFDGWIGPIFVMTSVFFLFPSYLNHVCQLLSMEHIAYEERNDKKENTSELQIERFISQMKRGLW